MLGPGYAALPGGKGANQAVAAALDGAPAAFAGAVGADAMAEVALAGLRGAGVDLSRLATVAAPTACAAVCVDPAGPQPDRRRQRRQPAARAAQVEDAALTPGDHPAAADGGAGGGDRRADPPRPGARRPRGAEPGPGRGD